MDFPCYLRLLRWAAEAAGKKTAKINGQKPRPLRDPFSIGYRFLDTSP
jgi:hypothetical protein